VTGQLEENPTCHHLHPHSHCPQRQHHLILVLVVVEPVQQLLLLLRLVLVSLLVVVGPAERPSAKAP
jgi:hypothetical protein